MMRRHAAAAALLMGLAHPLAAAEPAAHEVRDAVTRALPLIQKGSAGHRAQRSCFACHHQAIPILAMTTARSRGLPADAGEIQKHLHFIADFLDRNRDEYRKGQGQGGQADTAGYALWTLELGGWKPDATTAAVAEYLLLRNKDRDHWQTTSHRPPSEASPFTTTYLAVRALQAYGTAEQKGRIDERLRAARGWLARAPATDTEDRVFRLWAMRRAGSDAAEVGTVARQLLRTQRPDGGWGQLDTLPSDAYATGTALVALHEAAGLATTDPAYRRGLRHLLAGQRPDGTWYVHSRSKPFQTYFESGFPHGEDQFISLAASSWATTALALALPAAPAGPAGDAGEGFVNLFPDNGVPRGWLVRQWDDLARPVGDAPWIVKDGVLHSGRHRGTWLVSEREYADFVLEFEIKLTARGNSGVALRAPLRGDPAFDGMEMQVADLRYNPSAKPDELTGALYRAVAPGKQVYKPTEWNRFRIELRGTRLKATLNGEPIQDVDLSKEDRPAKRHDGSDAPPLKDRPGKGHVGFQHLSRDDEPVLIRGARIKELK
jgi:hypothetical protein